LPENFSKTSNGGFESPLQVSCHGATSSGGLLQAQLIRSALRCRGQISDGWSGTSLEVSAYSTDAPERACEAGYRYWMPHQGPGWKVTVDQIPRCFRKALQQPPRLAAIAHGKLST